MRRKPRHRVHRLPIALLIAFGLAACGSQNEESASEYATEATHGYHASAAVEVTSVSQLVASSDLVVFGKVSAVEAGPSSADLDGSKDITTTRLIVVDVTKTFYKSMDADTPKAIKVSDGYWVNREGYQSEDLGWAEVGDEAYFFVDVADNADTQEAHYDLMTVSGRVIVSADHLHYAPTGLWDTVRPRDTAQVEQAIAAGATAARTGNAEPLTVQVCKPSVPDDENSEPICTEEEA